MDQFAVYALPVFRLQTVVRIRKQPALGPCGEAITLRARRVPAVWSAKRSFLIMARRSWGFVVPGTPIDVPDRTKGTAKTRRTLRERSTPSPNR